MCPTCRVRRPLRSKHDQYTGRCIARFDHYCFFTNQAIGARNHAWFMLTLFFTWTTFAWFLRLAWSGAYPLPPRGCDVVALPPFTTPPLAFIEHDRILLYQFLQTAWLCYQLAATWFMHVRMTALNYTTNEFLNRAKYAHLQAGNPFSLGSLTANYKDWWAPQPPYKWSSLFYLDDLPHSTPLHAVL